MYNDIFGIPICIFALVIFCDTLTRYIMYDMSVEYKVNMWNSGWFDHCCDGVLDVLRICGANTRKGGDFVVAHLAVYTVSHLR